ncbi:MAG: ABC transporter permease [Bradymonadaceae bacterium]
MKEHLTDPEVLEGLAQIAVSVVLAAVVVLLAGLRGIASDFRRELVVAFGRGFAQIMLMGVLVGALFAVPLWWSGVVLVAMMAGAAWISHERGDTISGAYRLSFISVGVGSGVVIAAMTWAGAIEPTVRNLLPVGSMIVASSMKTNSLALERFVDEAADHRPQIEALLSLGVEPGVAVERYLERGVRASLIPVVDSLKSLGWVWIPGMMAGMVLSGANPIYAAEYQFVIMAMIFAAGGLTSLVSSLLAPNALFTDAAQLRDFD